MKISIENFKSIQSLRGYEMRPLTILSGTNSSGKSSFIQLLLLLKQTIDLDSAKTSLYLDGELYQVSHYKDIVTNKELNKPLRVTFEFTKEEDMGSRSERRISLFDSFNYTIQVEIEYRYDGSKPYVAEFGIKYVLPQGDKREQYIKFCTTTDSENRFRIDANNQIFGDGTWGSNIGINEIRFSSIFPSFFEVRETNTTPSLKKGQADLVQEFTTRYFPKIDGIRDLINSTFGSISYIGPLREQPKDEYSHRNIKQSVGKSGEYTAQVLQSVAHDPIVYQKPDFTEEGVQFSEMHSSLIEGVRYWICSVFKLSKDIYAKKTGDVYSILLLNSSDVETTIKHVGFGISQILPIVVEGLRLPSGSTLILEQPEIHLHPKLQSLLFDFLYSLVLQNKKIVIETHSDHFITRMRRRIAEEPRNQLADKINLTFIDNDDGQALFGVIDLDDFGSLDYFPDEFIEQSNQEMKAIIRAQMKKRSTKK